MARGDWKPPPQKPRAERTVKMVRAAQVLKGDEIRLSTKGVIGKVLDVKMDDEGRRVILTDTLGERVLHPETNLLRLDPKPNTKADQRRPR